jgi:hypothetical protein
MIRNYDDFHVDAVIEEPVCDESLCDEPLNVETLCDENVVDEKMDGIVMDRCVSKAILEGTDTTRFITTFASDLPNINTILKKHFGILRNSKFNAFGTLPEVTFRKA